MEDSAQNAVKIHNQDEALSHVDTTIRQKWSKWAEDNSYPPLGEASIAQEAEVEGHKAWKYTIDGLPQSRDGRQRWLLDTGETFDTTLSDDENTLEKALAKLRSKADDDSVTKNNLASLAGVDVEELSLEKVKEKAASLLGVKAEDLSVADAGDIGARFYEDVRGGKSLIIGNDGGLLFANSSVPPSDHIQAYKDGKRTPESSFVEPIAGDSATVVAKQQSIKLLQPEDLFSHNLEPAQLSEYIESLVQAVNSVLSDETTSWQLNLQIQLAPQKGPEVKLSHNGATTDEVLQAIYENISKVDAPKVSQDVLAFEVLVSIN